MMDELWFYLSFADAKRPKGEQFLGGLYVRAFTLEGAITRSHVLGLNPGGEVRIIGPLTSESMDEYVSPEDRERLLTREEIESA
jgi:hypothetical protein